MKLAICTDVFADLSYTDMLDKVKSLGIDAVEMTAGGWGARKHSTPGAARGRRQAQGIHGRTREARHAHLCTEHVLQPALAEQDRRGIQEVHVRLRYAGRSAGRQEDRCDGWSAGWQRNRHHPELDHLYRFLAGFHGSGV